MKTTKLASFATSMRAASLVEDLQKAGINATTVSPKWTNKKLPPPRIEVHVADNDVADATMILAKFNRP